MFKKRICEAPHINGESTPGVGGCPDMWELENGDVAVIGLRKTSQLKSQLPIDARCGIDEEIVVVPGRLIDSIKNGTI